ncbi:intracellular membrane-bound Ca2+-independent phospholipase A2 [Colletotrichum plurivorum]|uniref:Intracellular membrane-bound Ca2+-independent phospholipase A2 n=1 Tax=Colletotrichum plurivorum TaxID=2175906 RepID=A0A8H6KXS8_9PEZI|nr:intracellular membrane-bound Ca2+-independent phospholipase A2 [Colletotrichum plurivorum]
MRPRVLCLDGGGIRGLSEILILKELMLQVRIQNHLDYTPEPYECFDFICGTSTGGLLAVLIGRLGRTLNECEALFRTLGSKIFEGGNLKQTLRMLSTGSKHTSRGLSEVIREEAGDETMHRGDASVSGKVPVAVITVSKTTHDDYLFRSYGVRAGDEACHIVDACLATSAATTFFPSVTINGVEYVDGAFKKNNPSGAALLELESTDWPMPLRDAVTGVECLVSVGTGRPTFKRASSSTLLRLFPGAGSLKDAATLCIKIAIDCDEAHRAVENRFRKANMSDSYYRFDVDRGLEAVELNESDNEALQMISAVTKSYLKGRQTEVERCARSLKPRSSE